MRAISILICGSLSSSSAYGYYVHFWLNFIFSVLPFINRIMHSTRIIPKKQLRTTNFHRTIRTTYSELISVKLITFVLFHSWKIKACILAKSISGGDFMTTEKYFFQNEKRYFNTKKATGVRAIPIFPSFNFTKLISLS